VCYRRFPEGVTKGPELAGIRATLGKYATKPAAGVILPWSITALEP
jgi:hypothetical protein